MKVTPGQRVALRVLSARPSCTLSRRSRADTVNAIAARGLVIAGLAEWVDDGYSVVMLTEAGRELARKERGE